MLAHNTRQVSEAEAPKSWTDVLDPKWRNQLAVGHPGFSGAIGIWAVQMRKMYSWDYFKRLERNRPQIGRSSIDPVTMLNAGERSRRRRGALSARPCCRIARGNPLRLIYPTEGVLATISPSAIPRQRAAPERGASCSWSSPPARSMSRHHPGELRRLDPARRAARRKAPGRSTR